MDYAHNLTDKKLKALENKIAKEYKKAAKTAEKNLNNYLDKFKKQDAEWQKLVASGAKTKTEYMRWRQSTIASGQRWKELRDNLAQDMTNANKIAMGAVREHMPEVYALNHNYGTFEAEGQSLLNTSYTLYDRHTVERLFRESPNLLPKPKVDIPKDLRWNRQKIQSAVTQGILLGESMDKIAKRMQGVADMNQSAAIRNARTAVTSAENGGRLDSYKRAESMGIKMKKQWLSTPDGRTRDSHREVDGETVGVNENFSNGLEFPGDPGGPPEEVYNCRCTMVGVLDKVDHDSSGRFMRLPKGQSYDEWKKGKSEKARKIKKAPAFSYDKFGIIPNRPRRSDFENYEDFLNARNKYKTDKEEITAKVSKWFDENYSGKTISDSELEKWAKQNDIKIYGSLDGLDRTALKAYTERYDQLINDFPMVKQYHEKMGFPFEIAYRPDKIYDAEATHGMTFGAPMSDFKNYVVSGYDQFTNGEFVMGYSPVVRTFDHEFGHQLYFSMTDVGIERSKERNEQIWELRRDFLTSVYKKNGMSEYATVNEDELFAEAFTAWYGGEKTDFANSFGEFLKRYGVVK